MAKAIAGALAAALAVALVIATQAAAQTPNACSFNVSGWLDGELVDVTVDVWPYFNATQADIDSVCSELNSAWPLSQSLKLAILKGGHAHQDRILVGVYRDSTNVSLGQQGPWPTSSYVKIDLGDLDAMSPHLGGDPGPVATVMAGNRMWVLGHEILHTTGLDDPAAGSSWDPNAEIIVEEGAILTELNRGFRRLFYSMCNKADSSTHTTFQVSPAGKLVDFNYSALVAARAGAGKVIDDVCSVGVGGIAEYPQLKADSASGARGSATPSALALVGIAAGGTVLLAAGGWYARRRWHT